MASESPGEMLYRVQMMTRDTGDTWDLSPRDREAIAHALATIARLTAERDEARSALASAEAPFDDVVLRHHAVMSQVERERDEARAKSAQHVEHLESLTQERDRLRVDLGTAQCSVASGVWFWQGEGDRPESLSCPVVMSADTARALVRERDDALADREKLTCHDLLSRGGEWLGAARSWIQRRVRNGESVTWGSNDVLEKTFTVDDIERLASEVAAAAMRPQPSEERLGQALKARWAAERERDEARDGIDQLSAIVRGARKERDLLTRETLILMRERDEARGLLREAHRAIDPDRWIQSECEDLRARIEAHLGGGK